MAELSARALLDRVAAADVEVAKLERERAIEDEVQRRLAKRLEAQKARPRRSQMTAMQIARYLEAHGREAFEALPK